MKNRLVYSTRNQRVNRDCKNILEVKLPCLTINSTNTEIDARLDARRLREAAIIARIDEAIDGGPKMSHPPVFRDNELGLDYTKIVENMGKKAAAEMKAEREQQKKLNLYINRVG